MNYTHRPAVSIYSNLKGLESYSPILISIIFLTEANSTESIVPASPLSPDSHTLEKINVSKYWIFII